MSDREGSPSEDLKSISFHEEAAKRFNELGCELAAKVRDLPNDLRHPGGFSPDLAIAATLSAEELGDIYGSRTTPDGIATRLDMKRGGRVIGLEGEDARSVAVLADAIYRHRSVSDQVSVGWLNTR